MVSPDASARGGKSGSRLNVGRRQVLGSMAYLYILKTVKNSYYIGSTDNLELRLKYHSSGKVKSTKSKLPIQLVYKEYFPTKSEAQKKEYKIKKWKSRKMIEVLLREGG